MGLNLTRKIIREHLAEGKMEAGEEIALNIDHILTHDSLGMISFLYFESMGIARVRTKLSVCYVDHNMLQLTSENTDDHRFLQSAAAKWGIRFSRAGNGICHQVHLERFSEPGATMLGSDSHTPTCGAVGMLAIGAGSLDVAVAMAGGPFHFQMPKVVRVNLVGRLQPWVASKDVILELLRRLSVKGGTGRVFEFCGDGASALTVPQRGTICNMGAELGAIASIFPSDEPVRLYLRAQQREGAWKPLQADPDASYDETVEIDLGALEPLIACPSSPDRVVPIREVEGTRVNQVCVGSCTNSSLADLEVVAAILKGKRVHPEVSLTITPGSRQVLQMISRSGALADLIDAGARVLESACGPCIGMGQAPAADSVSLRTFNRNFPGRSGTTNDRVYLCSPEVAALAAVAGEIVDPRRFGEPPRLRLPERFPADDGMILPPSDHPETVEIVRGPGIRPLPRSSKPPSLLRGQVLLKAGDNISTDDIVPTGAKVLPPRHNIAALSDYAFMRVDAGFPQRAREAGGGIIVGGYNYGQGSSREYAALVPMYLGIRAVLAKSFARIHWTNLVNLGILPVVFADDSGYDLVEQGDLLELEDVPRQLAAGQTLLMRNVTRGVHIKGRHDMTSRQVQIYLEGGLLNYVLSAGI